MKDLPLSNVPRDGEIIELSYRFARSPEAYLDLLVHTSSGERRLRFMGPRVVQLEPELPEVMRGIELEDLHEHPIGPLALWVSVAGGAATFWARSVAEVAAPVMRTPDPLPLMEAEGVRALGLEGIPRSSFRYRSPGRGGALRHFSVAMRPYARA